MLCPRCDDLVDPGHKLCPSCEMDDADEQLGEAQTDLDRYRHALESANEICRSAFAIADREGQTTNWQAFRARAKESLAIQHRVLYPEQ